MGHRYVDCSRDYVDSLDRDYHLAMVDRTLGHKGVNPQSFCQPAVPCRVDLRSILAYYAFSLSEMN